MSLFFEIKTEADRKLMADYDAAVSIFRDKVSEAMEQAAVKEPSLRAPMRAAAEAVRQRPLPSEANSDKEALKRLTRSSLIVEGLFAKIGNYAKTQEAFDAVMEVVACMKETGKSTTGKPEFRPLTQAVLKAVAELKDEVSKEMSAKKPPRRAP